MFALKWMKSLWKFLFLLLLSNLPVVTYSQNWLWAHDGEGIGNNASNAITSDPQGNTYMTGYIAGQAFFSGTNYQGRGVEDVYIAKYDNNGNLVWVKLAGGDGNERAYGIKYQNGNLYITGRFEDTAYFESTQLISRGGADIFVAKYDDNGNLIWVRKAGGPNQDYASSLDLDDAGNVYIAGSYQNSIVFDTVHLSTANLYNESFYAKYDNNGNLVWAKTTVGNGSNLITGIAFDHHNSVFVTGFFGGTLRIDTGTVNSLSPSYDIFLAKIDEGAGLEWITRAGSSYEDEALAVCSDNNGNPIMTGYYSGTAFFGPDSVTHEYYDDVFVAKYDGNGNNLWVRGGKGPHIDIGFALISDNSGNIFVTGIFEQSINFDGNTLSCTARQTFTVSYSPYGNVRWLVAAGGTQTAAGLGINLVPSGNVAISGYYEYTCIFGSTPALTVADASNIFIAEYDPPAVNDGIVYVGGNDLKLHPNPVIAGQNVFLNLPISTGYRIVNTLGETFSQGELTENGLINTTGLKTGFYLVELKGDKNGVAKLVIE
ncbi:MAG: hypothetical protein JWO06_260 [Bacteroidota bacterium]|nr:hypothetical protein [Bacteroidota bacterium]